MTASLPPVLKKARATLPEPPAEGDLFAPGTLVAGLFVDGMFVAAP